MDRAEFLQYTYESINSDLHFAETKNTFLTTFNLAIIGATISFIFGSDVNMAPLTRTMFIAFVVVILLATSISILSFFPALYLGKPKSSSSPTDEHFMFYKYNYKRYFKNYVEFRNDIKQYFGGGGFTPAEKQLMAQIIDLSNIAYNKYAFFTIALITELISFAILIVALCV